MRFNVLKAIYLKELLDLVRDRRTMISMVVVPVLIFPLIMFVMTRVMTMMEAKSEREAKSLKIAYKASPEIETALRNAGLQVVAMEDVRGAIAKKDAVAGVVETGPLVEVVVDSSNQSSSTAGDKIRVALNELKDAKVKASLRNSGIAESVLSPFTIKRVNVAPAKKMAGMVWGSMLGYMLLLLMFSGGMYPVIDMTAGEKERKTLETFLVSPAGRNEVVLGKIFAAMTSIFLTAALTLFSIVVSIRTNKISSKSEEVRGLLSTIPIDGNTIGLIILTLIPLCVFAASVMIAIAMFARSFKEGQSYLTPLIFVVLFPALLGGLPGLELTPWLCLIPIFNASQLLKGILQDNYTLTAFLVTMGANIAYAAIAFVIAKRRFSDESVLFRT